MSIVIVIITMTYIDRNFDQKVSPRVTSNKIIVKHTYKEGSYFASFLQTGGVGSKSVQLSAGLVNTESGGYLNPPENYVSYYINIPGIHAWVNCADNKYYAIDPESDSNEITETDTTFGVGIEIKNQLQNKVSFVCVPK